jgi:tRNA pseudouridine38-40 synthase
MQVKITISYDGSKFNGFQIQNNKQKVITVAGQITKALKNLNIETTLIGSGRTDTGVHATAQVLHCELPKFWKDLARLKDELNRMISPNIHIKEIEYVDEKFHARFSAKKRLYRYILYSGEFQPFLSDYALHLKSIDVKKLDKILKYFIGVHDFKNFKKQGSETSSDTREIFNAGAYSHKGLVIIYFLGNSFLRSQVRMMTNFALKVMQNELTYKELKEQIESDTKHSTGVIPPSGLYLAKVFY